MPAGTVQGSAAGGYIPAGPPDLSVLNGGLHQMASLDSPGLVDRAKVIDEIQRIQAAIRLWHTMEPDQAMREASAYSARLTELRFELMEAGVRDRQYTRLATQVNYTVDEIDRQFKLHSRMIEIRRQDLELMR
jgi:hypothetical protein